MIHSPLMPQVASGLPLAWDVTLLWISQRDSDDSYSYARQLAWLHSISQSFFDNMPWRLEKSPVPFDGVRQYPWCSMKCHWYPQYQSWNFFAPQKLESYEGLWALTFWSGGSWIFLKRIAPKAFMSTRPTVRTIKNDYFDHVRYLWGTFGTILTTIF